MSEPGNNGRGGVIVSVSEKLIKVLPPAFLLLCILNVIFLGVASYVFGHNTDARNAMLARILDSCLSGRVPPVH
jgi:TRAP-type mannitol/chloroaromatic compound transport system permease large subunit